MNRRSAIFGTLGAALASAQTPAPGGLREIAGAKPRNIVFILTDDHRYDALGFMKAQPFLETPRPRFARARRRPLPERLRHHGAVLAEPRVDPDRPLRPPAQGRRQQHPDPARHAVLPAVPAEGRLLRPASSASGTWATRATRRSRASTTGSASAARAPTCPSSERSERRRQARPAEGLHHRRADRLRARLARRRPQGQAVLPVPLAQGGALRVHSRRAPQGPLREREVRAAADAWRPPATGPQPADVGAEPAQQLARRRVSRTTRELDICANTTSGTPRRCWRWTRAWAACSMR